MNVDEKVPLSKVLDDMYNPDGGLVSIAARDYYYRYYATDEERKIMDYEDKMDTIIAIIFWGVIFLMMVFAVVLSLI